MKKDNSPSLTPPCFLLKTHVDVNLKTLLLTKKHKCFANSFHKKQKTKNKKRIYICKKQKEPREQLLTLKAQQIRHYHKNE